MTIIYWAAGWLVGIWLASQSSIPAGLWLGIAVLALLSAALWRERTAVCLLLLTAGAAALGALRYDLARPSLDPSHIASRHSAGMLTVTGWLARRPQLRDTSQQLVLRVESAAVEGAPEEPLEGLIQVRAPRFPVFQYGTRLQVTGEVTTPEPVEDFDYPAYLARQGIFSEMVFPQISVVDGARGTPLLRGLTAVRDRAQDAINQMLPDPQAALLSGILLGNDQSLPRELQEDFRATGLTHIIAISGFNIAIIAGLLLQASRLLAGRRLAAAIAFSGVFLYTVLVGAEASVVRAAIMGILVILAVQLLGRPTYAPAALGSAAFFMTLANPNILWDIGFQLSAAATLGLLTAVGPVTRRLRGRSEARLGPGGPSRVAGLAVELIVTTLVAFIFTLPVLLYHFGRVSIISLPANLAIVPVQAWLMLWGGAGTLLGMVHPALGQLPAWVSWLFLTYTIAGVRFFASLPQPDLQPQLPNTAVLLLAVTLVLLAGYVFRRSHARAAAEAGHPVHWSAAGMLPVAGVLAALALAAFWRAPDGRLHVTFLDVGQGDAILIQTPAGRQMVVDGGAYPTLLLNHLGDRLPFWDKSLDVVLATHPDTDHVAGLVDVLAHYDVDHLIGSTAEAEGSPAYAALLQAGSARQIACHVAQAGEIIRLDQDVTLEVLQAARGSAQSDNDNSIVLLLRYQDLRVLLTGDSETTAENHLLREGRLAPVTVLKAAHHGARTSTSTAFLQAVRPTYVVISAGTENRFGHPHPETLERIAGSGATVLRTDEMGILELVSDGTQLWWR